MPNNKDDERTITDEQQAALVEIIRGAIPDVAPEEALLAATVVAAAARGDQEALGWLRTRRGEISAVADRVVEEAKAQVWMQ